MSAATPTVLIMAAGTGGHVFPALSIAKALEGRAAKVHWLGTLTGMENQLLKDFDFPVHQISVSGLRGSGVKRKVLAPIMLLSAFSQSIKVLRRVDPDCVLGMGGFVCGPAGIAAKVLKKPLLIHEQNAVAGLTNRLLSKLSSKVLEAFPGTFKKSPRVLFTGNPVRSEILNMQRVRSADVEVNQALNLLVLGGSQGAAAINHVLPQFLAQLDKNTVNVLHQTGKSKDTSTLSAYVSAGLELGERYKVTEFINDMAAAYEWADLVICRSGASTVSEIAAAGVPSVLVPYPYHQDDQQLFNARWLENSGAAVILEQNKLSVDSLLRLIGGFLKSPEKLIKMGENAKELAVLDAADVIADECLRCAHA